jgi:hypothetical protein
MLYVAGMVVALFVCSVLLLFPSSRRFALRFAAAVIGSLPGVLLFQFIVGIPLAVFYAVVLGSCGLFHPPDTALSNIVLSAVAVVFVSVLVASLFGCYTGGHIAWRLAESTPWRTVVAEEPAFRFAWKLFRRARPNHAMERTADRPTPPRLK